MLEQFTKDTLSAGPSVACALLFLLAIYFGHRIRLRKRGAVESPGQEATLNILLVGMGFLGCLMLGVYIGYLGRGY